MQTVIRHSEVKIEFCSRETYLWFIKFNFQRIRFCWINFGVYPETLRILLNCQTTSCPWAPLSARVDYIHFLNFETRLNDFRLFARESCRTLNMTPNQSSFCPINMRISMRLVTRLASRVIARVLLPLPCFRVEGRKYSLSMESSFHFWLLNFALCMRRFNQFFRKQHNLIRVF